MATSVQTLANDWRRNGRRSLLARCRLDIGIAHDAAARLLGGTDPKHSRKKGPIFWRTLNEARLCPVFLSGGCPTPFSAARPFPFTPPDLGKKGHDRGFCGRGFN